MKRINEIFEQHLFEAGYSTVEAWLNQTILGWCETYKVAAFFPFEEFFPSSTDEEKSMAILLDGFPVKKNTGQAFSPRGHARLALASLIAKQEFISRPQTWAFCINVARHMELTEAAAVFTALASNDRFRSARDDSGSLLLEIMLDASFAFGPTPEIRKFWLTCLSVIDTIPSFSVRLLGRLIECDPDNWYTFPLDAKMSHALDQHVSNMKQANPEATAKRLVRLRKQISDVLNDEQLLKGANSLRYSELSFLVDMRRLRSLSDRIPIATKAQESSVQPSRPRRTAIKSANLRTKAGKANAVTRALGLTREAVLA